jgi:hypothetical protein
MAFAPLALAPVVPLSLPSTPMAIEPIPDADAPVPTAVDPATAATALRPKAEDPSPTALELVPTAVASSPADCAPVPKAVPPLAMTVVPTPTAVEFVAVVVVELDPHSVDALPEPLLHSGVASAQAVPDNQKNALPLSASAVVRRSADLEILVISYPLGLAIARWRARGMCAAGQGDPIHRMA